MKKNLFYHKNLPEQQCLLANHQIKNNLSRFIAFLRLQIFQNIKQRDSQIELLILYYTYIVYRQQSNTICYIFTDWTTVTSVIQCHNVLATDKRDLADPASFRDTFAIAASSQHEDKHRDDWIGLSSVLRPRQHSIGYTGDGFYRSKDPTNSIKVLKEHIVHRQIKHTISRHEHKTQQVP